ncbi:hypothetical protein SNE40_010011 [Patella caerulea]|uniref:Uncharacterized protein n=1 Tax=Patella caerulea TaxID=87958 RepID=A0AAN8JPN9_PATCE
MNVRCLKSRIIISQYLKVLKCRNVPCLKLLQSDFASTCRRHYSDDPSDNNDPKNDGSKFSRRKSLSPSNRLQSMFHQSSETFLDKSQEERNNPKEIEIPSKDNPLTRNKPNYFKRKMRRSLSPLQRYSDILITEDENATGNRSLKDLKKLDEDLKDTNYKDKKE